MNNIETMKLALEALERTDAEPGSKQWEREAGAMVALRQAIEQAQQAEPDYYGLTKDHLWMSITKDHHDRLKPEFRMACYTSPPPRQPLTDECKKDIRLAIKGYFDDAYVYGDELYSKIIDALAAHGIKGEA